jgi:hypothetical protein
VKDSAAESDGAAGAVASDVLTPLLPMVAIWLALDARLKTRLRGGFCRSRGFPGRSESMGFP